MIKVGNSISRKNRKKGMAGGMLESVYCKNQLIILTTTLFWQIFYFKYDKQKPMKLQLNVQTAQLEYRMKQ